MILNFAERRVYFAARLRGVVCGTSCAGVNLGKKLHMKVRRTAGEPQLSLFFKIVRNSPTCGRVARVGAVGGPFGHQDIIRSAIRRRGLYSLPLVEHFLQNGLEFTDLRTTGARLRVRLPKSTSRHNPKLKVASGCYFGR